MPSSRNLTRQRLIHAAIELFATQGVTETTTKQIAELAAVNEVTLFRQFGNKHGLLLAVIEDAQVFTQLGQNLVAELPLGNSLPQMLRDYADTCLEALAQTPAVVRSLVGESGQYSPENRQALGKGLDRANRKVAQYLKTAIGESSPDLHLPVEQLAGLLNMLLFGYAAIELTSEFHGLWRDRSDFLDQVVMLFLAGAVAGDRPQPDVDAADLPAPLVHQILDKAKQHSPQTYAMIYVLFGAGLSVSELVRLTRSNHLSSTDRQLLQITSGSIRQIPINQWILGKRYGSYLKNPLTQWLKNRKDTDSALLLGVDGEPLTTANVDWQWQQLTNELIAPTGKPPTLRQAQSTWCVEMLMRGLTIESMQMLTGWDSIQLAPYLRRAQEQLALTQAVNLDRSPSKSTRI